ncbi:MAG TPA: carboxymuconolactone decarboxylase family protein [Yinghuangia sp.]|nr:carboxymuconolactone decarboxylase family protein [Yinghuangia sp.]
MARTEPLRTREWPRAMREALAAMVPPEPRHATPARDGRPKALNMLGTFAHHPALARAFFTFNGHILMATTLSPRHREMVVLRVAVLRKCGYEWAQHIFVAHDAGLTDDEISRVAYGPEAPRWTPLESTLLRAVDELIDGGAVTDDTWSALAEDLDTRQLVDLVFTVGAYESVAFFLRSFAVELDDDLRQD